jgi:hypothetical protein
MHRIATITTASDTVRLKFKGRGSIFPSGSFGGGTVEIYFVSTSPATGASTVSSSSAYTINGTTVKTADLPAGEYDIVLENSTDGNVSVFYNDQIQLVRS